MQRFVLSFLAALPFVGAPPAQHQDIKPGPWQKRHAPEGWIIHETPHYQVQSQCGLEKAERLGRHMEAMLKVYTKLFPTDRSLKQFPIKLFKDRESFVAYGKVPSAAAYYNPVDREMVCYDTGKWMDEKKAAQTGSAEEDEDEPSRMERLEQLYGMDTLGCAAHEGWHQYFHRYVTSWVEILSWINEGLGDYFYCAVPKDAPGRKELAAELGALNATRLPVVRWAVRNNEHAPIAKLITYRKDVYYGPKAGIYYAQGWALCHFLLHSDNPKYRQIIPNFVRLVRDDTNMEAITEKVWKGIDLVKLEEEWKTWVLAQRLPWEKPVAKKPSSDAKAGKQDPAKKEPDVSGKN